MLVYPACEGEQSLDNVGSPLPKPYRAVFHPLSSWFSITFSHLPPIHIATHMSSLIMAQKKGKTDKTAKDGEI
jgi:hypothetical protein